MPYHLQRTQLRVVYKYLKQQRNSAALQMARLIVLEHILPSTEEFLNHLRNAGADIFCVIAKPYSIDAAVLDRLTASGLHIVQKSYSEIEKPGFLDSLLMEAVGCSQQDNKQIVILEVGGYFALPLTRVTPDVSRYIAGVVEDTTFGHNRYLTTLDKIPVPVFSVARSSLKEIESRFVGRDAVAAVEHVLRALGVSVSGRKALVIGYGMIGANVARALRTSGLEVQVYDKHAQRNLAAFIDGFLVHKKRKLIESADIIFAATGDRALSWEEIEECKDNVILASVGSKDTEFDIAELKEQAIKSEQLGLHIAAYDISHSKRIVVIRDGTAVNFLLPSLPAEVLDLVFAEILICTMFLLKNQAEYRPGTLYSAAPVFVNSISEDWLRLVNIT